MASGVTELLDMLFQMIDEAKNVPLSSDKCMLERDKALDLVDEIRGQFPVELVEAQKVKEREKKIIDQAEERANRIMKQAEDRAERTIKQAEEKAEQLVAENQVLAQVKQRSMEIAHQAEERSAEMIRQAEERSQDLKRAANDYCEDAMRRTEEAVAEAYDEIKKSRSRFRAAINAMLSPPANSKQPFDAMAEEQHP